MDVLDRARSAFYNLGGPWYRNRLFETLGSERYAHPGMLGLDRYLSELMPWPGGTFLEAGAHDGYTQSNTYFLERHRGWTGILVEPVPELRAKCSRRRPGSRVLDCALVGPELDGTEVEIHFGDLTSNLHTAEHATGGLRNARRKPYAVTVPAMTLDSVLSRHAAQPLDIIILDLEGAEPQALEGLDLERHGPRYLLIEALEADLHAQFDGILSGYYDRAAQPTPYDLLYERRAH